MIETTEMLLNERRKQVVNATTRKALKSAAKKGLGKPKEKRIKGILTKKTTAKYASLIHSAEHDYFSMYPKKCRK